MALNTTGSGLLGVVGTAVCWMAWASPAAAQDMVERQVCVQIATEYWRDDVSDGAPLVGDVNTREFEFRRAVGARMDVTWEGTDMIFIEQLDDDGCAWIWVPTARDEVRLKVWADAEINGVHLEAHAELPPGSTDEACAAAWDHLQDLSCSGPSQNGLWNWDDFLSDCVDAQTDWTDLHGWDIACSANCTEAQEAREGDLECTPNNVEFPGYYYRVHEEVTVEVSDLLGDDVPTIKIGSEDGTLAWTGWQSGLRDLTPREEAYTKAWHLLAVGMWAARQVPLNLDDHGAEFIGGTGDACGQGPWAYTPKSDVLPPYWPEERLMFIGTPRLGSGGGRSSFVHSPYSYDSRVPGVGSKGIDKWVIAHELGHVIVEQRMGDRTDDRTGADACGTLGVITDNAGLRAPLRRQYSSVAVREAWATFFSAALWNSRRPECVYMSAANKDFDLDGLIDNNYTTAAYDGVYRCGASGGPIPDQQIEGQSVSSNDWLQNEWLGSPEAFFHGLSTGDRDWLDAALRYATGEAYDPEDVVPDLDNECSTNYGKSSMYDWIRYFWGMYDAGVEVTTLADVYVDMCPTNWNSTPVLDASSTNDADYWDRTPECRLEISTALHGVDGQHELLKDHGVDHLPAGHICDWFWTDLDRVVDSLYCTIVECWELGDLPAEYPPDWLASDAEFTAVEVDGRPALEIFGRGFIPVSSSVFAASDVTELKGRLALDVKLPANPPNPYWYGDVQGYASCPSAGVHNSYLGYVGLTGLSTDEFQTVSLTLPSDVYGAFESGVAEDCSMTIALNVDASVRDVYHLADLRFVD